MAEAVGGEQVLAADELLKLCTAGLGVWGMNGGSGCVEGKV